jgi:hypothetical protein
MKNSLSRLVRIISIIILSASQIQTCYTQEYYEEIIYPDTVNIISMLPFNHDTIFIGGNTEYATGGVYRTFDGGYSWDFTGLNGYNIYCLAKGIGDTIYASASWKVYKTGNFGNDWEEILSLSDNAISIACLGPGWIFVGYWGGIMRSLDYGSTWDSSLVISPNSSVINAILPITENEIYAGGTAYMHSDAGVFKSVDLGNSWDLIGLVNYNIQALGMNADHELFAGCFYSGLMKTSNDGLNWETVFPFYDVRSLIIGSDGMYVGCESQNYPNGGIYYSSDNGNSWEDWTYNITNINIKRIFETPDQYLYSLSRYESTVLGPPFNISANPVEIDEEDSRSDLKFDIIPNPASDFIQVRFSNELLTIENLKLSIFNLQGQLVRSDSLYFSKGDLSSKLNIVHLARGTYFVEIKTGKYRSLNKLVIQ